jgi:hypothetical protein
MVAHVSKHFEQGGRDECEGGEGRNSRHRRGSHLDIEHAGLWRRVDVSPLGNFGERVELYMGHIISCCSLYLVVGKVRGWEVRTSSCSS